MKKTISLLLLALVLFTSVPSLSLAAVSNSGQGSVSNSGGIQNPLGSSNKDLPAFLASLLRLAFLIGTMVAVFFIVYAGFKYVTAGGDEGAIKKAHQMLLWAAVGTAILLGAQMIAEVIKNTVQQLGA